MMHAGSPPSKTQPWSSHTPRLPSHFEDGLTGKAGHQDGHHPDSFLETFPETS